MVENEKKYKNRVSESGCNWPDPATEEEYSQKVGSGFDSQLINGTGSLYKNWIRIIQKYPDPDLETTAPTHKKEYFVMAGSGFIPQEITGTGSELLQQKSEPDPTKIFESGSVGFDHSYTYISTRIELKCIRVE